jgi:hypothetical protein
MSRPASVLVIALGLAIVVACSPAPAACPAPLVLATAAGEALPALVAEQVITPEEGEPTTLQLFVTEGTLALCPDGSYEHRYTVEGYVAGRLVARDTLRDRGSFEAEGDGFTFASIVLQNLSFTGRAIGDDVELQIDLAPHTGTPSEVAFLYRPA